MHQSALKFGKLFFDVYCNGLANATVVDIGSQNVNGSLKDVCPESLTYIGVDFVEENGVDIVLDDPYKLPFDDESIDVVVCSSCFEHSQFFWLLFLEIVRSLKPGGLLYLNAPSNGSFHRYPFDCWRFYPDSGKALVAWANREGYPLTLLESFIGDQSESNIEDGAAWHDFVAVFVKLAETKNCYETRIVDDLPNFTNGYSSISCSDLNETFISPDHLRTINLNHIVADRDGQIASLNQVVVEYYGQIASLNQAITERNRQIASFNQAVTERDGLIAGLNHAVAELDGRISALYSSRSWRLARPIRWSGRAARRLRSSLLEAPRLVYHQLPLSLGQRSAIRAWYYRLSGADLPGIIHECPESHPGALPQPTSPFTRAALTDAPVKILLIERTVPRQNQDAGSMMIHSFIRVFRDFGHAVTFLPIDLAYDPDYTPNLQALGVTCLHAPEVRSIQQHLAEAGTSYDIILACRPDHTDAMIPVLRAQCPQARLLYETIDLHFVREQRQAELEQNDRMRAHARWRKEQELRIAAAVDCTIVVSEQERQILLKENPKLYVEVIPVVGESFGCGAGFAERCDLVFIGGYEHRPNVDAVVYFVREILPMINQQRPEIRLHVVGSHPPTEITSLACGNVITHGFIPDITELMNQVKISVNPLRFGAGVKGKLITCMSYGVPCVGTSIAVEGMGIVSGRQALVVDTPEQFAAAVLRLYSDQTLWEYLSAEGMALAHQQFSLEVAAQGFTRIFNTVLSPAPRNDLQLERITSQEAYQQPARSHKQQHRQAIEAALASGGEPIITLGFCFVCGHEVAFHTDLMYGFSQPDGSHTPNWRERVVCPECQLNNRMRAAIHLFHLLCAPTPESHLYITEQTTPFFAWCQHHYPHVIGSEYLGDILPTGTTDSHGIRNESLTALSFTDNQFDAILSFDVIEHIPDYLQAFRECLRCLKPGGTMFFTVPFNHQSQHHIVRAELDEAGQIHHLLPPEYHGDPINANGCLCFYHFGWELLEQLRGLGFRDVAAYFYWSQRFGYLGCEQLLFRAVK
ncbi:MAG: methyltransferase domain-containing protein [Steroidobacteraceae bacterium]|nr:methyltransferase domain-containing protein [Deltaproteobacteria bacterium]